MSLESRLRRLEKEIRPRPAPCAPSPPRPPEERLDDACMVLSRIARMDAFGGDPGEVITVSAITKLAVIHGYPDTAAGALAYMSLFVEEYCRLSRRGVGQ
jgi:hypothetical protein